MDLDNSWDAVFRPDLASEYFGPNASVPFQHDAGRFRANDAWWMAEVSRLAYRQGPHETGRPGDTPTRDDLLQSVGLTEVAFVDREGSQASVVRPLSAPGYVVVAFRGSDDVQAWLDFNAPVVLSDWTHGGKVHLGFKSAFELVWGEIQTLLPPDTPAVYTGHSLGGALALLAMSARPGVCAYSFGGPRVGDPAFAQAFPGQTFYRVVNHRDIVTELPPPLGLTHVGQLHYIASDGNIRKNPSDQDVLEDRKHTDPVLSLPDILHQETLSAPEAIADHAPVNYVARLDHALDPPLTER